MAAFAHPTTQLVIPTKKPGAEIRPGAVIQFQFPNYTKRFQLSISIIGIFGK
jgi:hypothetical protein